MRHVGEKFRADYCGGVHDGDVAAGDLQVDQIKSKLSRQVSGEGTKASTTRVLIFDISFLMLCHTVQTYGPQVKLQKAQFNNK